MRTAIAILLALWASRHGDEPTRLECLRRLVAAEDPPIKPIARGIR